MTGRLARAVIRTLVAVITTGITPGDIRRWLQAQVSAGEGEQPAGGAHHDCG